jgi:hypothetical protein
MKKTDLRATNDKEERRLNKTSKMCIMMLSQNFKHYHTIQAIQQNATLQNDLESHLRLLFILTAIHKMKLLILTYDIV